MDNNKIIEVKNLNVSFKRRKKKPLHIIRGINLSIEKGKIIGIVGESGSGKSVTTKALLGLNGNTITTADHINIDGEKNAGNLKKFPFKNIRGEKISYIPQNPMTSLNPSRKIWKHIFDVMWKNKDKYKKNFLEEKSEIVKNINAFKEIYEKTLEEYKALNNKTKEQKKIILKDKLQKTKKAYINAKKILKFKFYLKTKIIELLDKFKIENAKNVVNLYPHELSGGMKQRIIISISVLAGSKIIIADEPTTALDPAVQSSVLKLLQEINEEYNITILFISHNISVIAKFVDYVYVVYAGKVLECAEKYELFANPKHPYTWALISSLPQQSNKGQELYKIPGTPPDMENLPYGDAFAPRNKYAIALDFKQEPPLFKVNKNHYAATWTLHPSYGKVNPPKEVLDRTNEFIKNYRKGKNVKKAKKQ